MSGPVSPPLATTESGTTVRVQPTNTLEFNGADFTVSQSGSKATISIDSTGTGAALTATQVGFGDSSNLLTGSSKFTYNETAELLTLTCSDNTDTLVIKSTDSDANVGPIFTLFRDEGAPGSTDDKLGQITFKGNDAGEVTTTYAQITGYIIDATSSSEDGMMFFEVADGTRSGAVREKMRIRETGVEINAVADDTCDFTIRGDVVNPLFKTDSSQDNIGIGTSPDSAVERLHISGTGTDDMVRIESTDAGSGTAPDIVFYRSSASPAANDFLGRVDFRGKDSAGADLNYGVIAGQITDPTNTSEDGAVLIKAAVNGDTNLTQPNASFKASGTTFNDGGLSGLDFLVKGDTKNVLFVDASQDNLGIGTSAPSSGVERLHVQGTGQTNPMVMIESSDSPGVTDGNPSLRLYNSSSGGTNLQIGKIEFAGKNASSAEVQYFEIETLIADTTAASEDGRVDFNVKMGGAYQTYLRLGTTSQQVQINAAGTNIDTIIKSETQNFVFVSALSSNTHMAVGFNGEGTSQSSGGAQFQVDEDASFLLPVAAYTANHDITAVQAHGYALQMKTGSGTGTFTLPETAEIGMHVTVINFGSGMNVAVNSSSSHKINGGGSAGNSTTATVTAAGARYDCVYIATDVWNVTAPAVVTAS